MRMACPYDTNGDGDCGRRYCPFCGDVDAWRAPDHARAVRAIRDLREALTEIKVERVFPDDGPQHLDRIYGQYLEQIEDMVRLLYAKKIETPTGGS